MILSLILRISYIVLSIILIIILRLEAGNVPKDTLTGTKVDDTKYEVFVDYYDKPTDIFGTIIKGNDAVTVDTVKAQPEYLTIVSDGYVNYYKDTANYLGQYATKWYIYNEADQKSQHFLRQHFCMVLQNHPLNSKTLLLRIQLRQIL